MPRFAPLIAIFLVFALPDPALAHSPIKGLNNFYNGVLHPALVPAHAMLLVAFGLFLGQGWGKSGWKPLFPALMSFLAAVVVGLIAAWFAEDGAAEAYVLATALLVGVVVAVAPSLPKVVYFVAAVIAGFVLGLDSAQGELIGKEKFVALFGSGVGIYFLSLYPIGLAETLQRVEWHRIAVRVVGSWVAASALLVLTLSMSGGSLGGSA